MSHDLELLNPGEDPLGRVTEFCEVAALSELQTSSSKEPGRISQHRPLWLDGAQKAQQARFCLDRRVLQKLIDLDGQKVLDVGCGFGSTMHYLQESRDGTYSGLTLSRLEYTLGNETIQRKNLQSALRLFCADFHDALSWRPFPAQDLIYSLETLHLSWNHEAFFAGAQRSLRKDGALVVADFMVSADARSIQDEKDLLAYRTFRKGIMGIGLATADELTVLAGKQGFELVEQDNLAHGLKDGILERLGTLMGNPFNSAPEVRAFRSQAHGASANLGNLVKKDLVQYGWLVFRKN